MIIIQTAFVGASGIVGGLGSFVHGSKVMGKIFSYFWFWGLLLLVLFVVGIVYQNMEKKKREKEEPKDTLLKLDTEDPNGYTSVKI
jgi:hypothetical protein